MVPSALRPALLALCSVAALGLRAATNPQKGAAESSSWEFCAVPGAGGAPPDVRIPKLVHQTYKSATLPPRLEAYRSSWKRLLPDWEHRLWLDEDNRALVRDHYPWFLATYDSYDQTIKRVDAARLFMMHRHGGVYADTDVEAVRDPSPLFSGRHDLLFFAQSPIRCGRAARVQVPQTQSTVGAIPNALMASVPGHPFWLYLAMKLVSARREGLVMWATGPSRLTEALAAYQTEYPRARVAIYAMDYWAPFKWDSGACESTEECTTLYPDAYLISHWTGTWNHCEKGTCLQDDELRSRYRHTADAVVF
mmetsp:Transcript_80169/g.248823  ORF Transcript_80169/g.248823 Transcript_80169/m.248823 type:complete len:308 (-) Transcript_80169:52-975(-)